jgi:hypothetical protein
MPEDLRYIKEPKARYWQGWYLLVITVLVLEIVCFFWLTNKFK